MPRASILAIGVSALACSLAAAQRCQGFASFRGRPIQAFARGQLGNESRWYAAGVAFGSTAFGELELGAIDADAFAGASSRTIRGAVGYQAPLNERGTAQLCPIVQAVFASGPKNVNGSGSDYSEADFSFGLTAGVVANGAAAQVEIIPTGSIAVGNANSTFTAAAGSVPDSHTGAFGVFSFGVGLVLGQETSITPSVSRPFGTSGASTTFAIRVAFAFGGARSRALATPATSCATLASTDSTVYDTTQVSERATLRSAPEPDYPPIERDRGVEGRVIVAVVVGADGTPDESSARIVQSADPAFDREALRWIRKVSYWPACRDARAVRARVAQPVDFCVFGCRRGRS
jgi:TonB family protein